VAFRLPAPTFCDFFFLIAFVGFSIVGDAGRSSAASFLVLRPLVALRMVVESASTSFLGFLLPPATAEFGGVGDDG
jgi:hypothetical protein